MVKALSVYVLTAPFLFVLTIVSGMGSGGVQSQIRHTENTVMKMRTSPFSHYIKPVMSDWKQSTRKKINKRNSTNNDAEFSTGSFAFADSRPKTLSMISGLASICCDFDTMS